MYTDAITTNFMYKHYYDIYYIFTYSKITNTQYFVQTSIVFIVVSNTFKFYNSTRKHVRISVQV